VGGEVRIESRRGSAESNMKRSTSVRSGLSFGASAVERGPVGPAWIHRLVSGAFGVTLTASPRNLLALDPSMQVEVDRWGPGHDFLGQAQPSGSREGLLRRTLQRAPASGVAYLENPMAGFWSESPR